MKIKKQTIVGLMGVLVFLITLWTGSYVLIGLELPRWMVPPATIMFVMSAIGSIFVAVFNLLDT